jgi:hypothetical protein
MPKITPFQSATSHRPSGTARAEVQTKSEPFRPGRCRSRTRAPARTQLAIVARKEGHTVPCGVANQRVDHSSTSSSRRKREGCQFTQIELPRRSRIRGSHPTTCRARAPDFPRPATPAGLPSTEISISDKKKSERFTEKISSRLVGTNCLSELFLL